MSLVIGNVRRSILEGKGLATLPAPTVTLPSGYDPNDTLTAIYGVDFPDYRNSPSTKNAGIGKRTYAAKDMTLEIAKATKFHASTATVASTNQYIKVGHDDFVGKGPFKIRECVTSLGSDGKQHVMHYKDDIEKQNPNQTYPWYNSTYAMNTNYNTMIEFPKFYYRRPSPYEFQVSSTKHPGFECSPMHSRNDTEYPYCYISKYQLQTTNYYSYCNTVSNTTATKVKCATVRETLNSKGLRLFDYKCYYSLAMLMFIKYAVLNASNFIGVGTQATVSGTTYAPSRMIYLQSNPAMRYCTEANSGTSSTNTVFNGYGSNDTSKRSFILTLGLELYYGHSWIPLDGLYYYNSALWISKDPTTLPAANMTVASITNASNFDSLYLNMRDFRASGKDSLDYKSSKTFAYFPNYPYLLIPSSGDSSYNIGIGDRFLYNNVTTTGGTTEPRMATGCGQSLNSLGAGPSALDLAVLVSASKAEIGFRSFFVA